MHPRDTQSGNGSPDRTPPPVAPAVSGVPSTSGVVTDQHPQTIRLNHALNFCRHGHELQDLSAQSALGHWIVWGHYACPHCKQVALDALDQEPPNAATIAGRLLPILIR
jgi:hypothetical protein